MANMVTSHEIWSALSRVGDQRTFVRELLAGALQWPIDDHVQTLPEITYDWSERDLRADGLDKHLADGKVAQIQPLRADQPWGIFILEFTAPEVFTAGRGITGPLRQVLRGLVRNRNKPDGLPSWNADNLLFICTYNYQHYRFAYFKKPAGDSKTAPLATFGWNKDEPARTACEINLPELLWPARGTTPADWTARWAGAFDVEKVTKRFYQDYRGTFETVEKLIHLDTPEEIRLFTQTLFNRLMFLRFIERKNWLTLNGRHDYLRALYEAGLAAKQPLYKSRIRKLFFEGLAVDSANKPAAIGTVPFLNGGLFEESDLDKAVKDIPDAAFGPIISADGLFYHYNFTVEESTPLDIEVAVDPEMLGRVFEELVTGRHESGSYYTPRPIVSFMCREALKGYLADKLSPLSPSPGTPPSPGSGTPLTPSSGTPGEGWGGGSAGSAGNTLTAAIAALVDKHQIMPGLTDAHASQVRDALTTVKAVDPACGSGAYLLGLLQELIAIRRAMENPNLAVDKKFLYDLKLHIISHNLYGVDIDPFATNIAMLRLWLALAVEADTPLPLPNLDFKIETGDSLTGPCAWIPDSLDGAALLNRATLLIELKNKYMTAHGGEKFMLRGAIHKEEKAIGYTLRALRGEGVIDWRVQFAEVFAKQEGFDIVLANPPYVRQESIVALKPQLQKCFPEVYTGTADLYTYFYARALQCLRPGGMLAFISSNKWFRAGYGKKLRTHIAATASVRTILDFHDLPVFESAIAYPMIFIAANRPAREGDKPILAEPPTLEPPYPDVIGVVDMFGQALPKEAFCADGTWNLASSSVTDFLAKMRAAGPALGEHVQGRIFLGIKTGLNEAFVIDNATRDELIAADPNSAEIIKPLAAGRDIKRWRVSSREKWLIVTRIGTDMKRYPAIFKHLKTFQAALAVRTDQGEHWWELRACAYYDIFEKPKIVFPDIAPDVRFAHGAKGTYFPNTTYVIDSDDRYLLGVLNSKPVGDFYAQLSAQIRGGYVRFFTQYVEQIPIPTASVAERQAIGALAQKCLDAAGVGCGAWEQEIDARVAGLYGI